MLCAPSTLYLSLHMHSPFPTLLSVLRCDLHGMQRQVSHCHTSGWLGQCEAQGEDQREGEKVSVSILLAPSCKDTDAPAYHGAELL